MARTPSPRRGTDDRLFRPGTGFFALLVPLLVAAIGFELWRTSRLSLVKFKHLAHLHGASVEVEGEVGRGSTFRIQFAAAPV